MTVVHPVHQLVAQPGVGQRVHVGHRPVGRRRCERNRRRRPSSLPSDRAGGQRPGCAGGWRAGSDASARLRGAGGGRRGRPALGSGQRRDAGPPPDRRSIVDRLGADRADGPVGRPRQPDRRGRGRLAGSPRVGRLIVIEGLDGAGKRTLADAVSAALVARRGAGSPGRPSRATTPTCTPSWSATRSTGGSATCGASVHGMARAVRAGPPGRGRRAAGRAGRARRRCSSTGTSRRTPPTARRGCTRTPAGEFVAWVRGAGDRPVRRPGAGPPAAARRAAARSPRTGRAPRAHRGRAGRATPSSPTTGCSGAPRRSTRQLAAASWLSPWTRWTAARSTRRAGARSRLSRRAAPAGPAVGPGRPAVGDQPMGCSRP